MHMMFTHLTLDDLYIVAVTYLPYQITHPLSYHTPQYFVSVLGYPDKVYSQIMCCMTTFSIFLFAHRPQYTKSLGLKSIVFTNDSKQ